MKSFVWAIAVFLMVEGNILGERNTDIATLLGMVGMFIILITYMHACVDVGKNQEILEGDLNKAFLKEGICSRTLI